MRALARDGSVAVAVLLGLSLASAAGATDDACFDAYVKAQTLRNGGKLTQAREQALLCARDTCPRTLKADCLQWTEEISRTLATVVFLAKDDRGQEVTAVAVYVDDNKVADATDGRPVTLDPGTHKVRFESGALRWENVVVVAAGDSNRHIEGTLSSPARAVATASATSSRRFPLVSMVMGGVAGVGLVSFVSFGIAGRAEQGCSPDCNQKQINAIHLYNGIADASWITGLVAVGVGVGFWLAQPSQPADASPATGMLRIGASPTRGGISFGVDGAF